MNLYSLPLLIISLFMLIYCLWPSNLNQKSRELGQSVISRIGQFVSNINDLVNAHSEREDDIFWIKSKLADQEDRLRRNNFKICGIPESIKPQELEAYFSNIISAALPDSPPEDLGIDCIHRLPKPKHVPEHHPRHTIFRRHYYHVKEKLLSLTRNKDHLTGCLQGLTLFADLSRYEGDTFAVTTVEEGLAILKKMVNSA